MIDMQLLGGVLVAVALLVGGGAGLAAAFLAAASFFRPSQVRPGQAPPGGIRRDVPSHPQPDTDDARTLVLR
jgi:hypothetical protein